MRCTLLMAGQYVFYLITVFIQFIVDIEYRSSRITKYGVNTLLEKTFHYNL